ncbi:hypothetical protein BOTBODRAFT_27424 [Botryobasidium botryosum FD-172 SS1]|uniref:Uncharacterized protein n=1 Tax=Botryobasidium botryosum (strain FD-172 SS1) TaxID=930990 RepID=A0A067MWM6_BOTB1|nr:hypothetical protein BOTBODRAFT_27424 [Botryobasidium botryosum FD-172 SS1]
MEHPLPSFAFLRRHFSSIFSYAAQLTHAAPFLLIAGEAKASWPPPSSFLDAAIRHLHRLQVMPATALTISAYPPRYCGAPVYSPVPVFHAPYSATRRTEILFNTPATS